MRRVGYPEIGRRVNLKTSNSRPRDPVSTAPSEALASMNKI
jgi:hypothetical protein